jgi:hypothetical protein
MGGEGNGRQMWCGARGSGSMAGEARAVLGAGKRPAAAALPCFDAEGGRRGQVGRVGQKVD